MSTKHSSAFASPISSLLVSIGSGTGTSMPARAAGRAPPTGAAPIVKLAPAAPARAAAIAVHRTDRERGRADLESVVIFGTPAVLVSLRRGTPPCVRIRAGVLWYTAHHVQSLRLRSSHRRTTMNDTLRPQLLFVAAGVACAGLA